MDVEKFKADLRKSTQRRVQRLYRIVGPLRYLAMVRSWQDAAGYMTEPDAKIRESALFILEMMWPDEPAVEVIFARALLTDRSKRIRERAMMWLGRRYLHTFDPNASAVFARACLDPKNPLPLRVEAYIQFCGIRKIDMPDELWDEIEKATVDLPAGMEWDLLKTFAARLNG